MSDIRVKICGLTQPSQVAAAAEAGAAYIGFNFFPKSPRYLDPEVARTLALEVPPGVGKVALVVDADDSALAALLDRVPIDIVQLHGSESPERVAEVRERFGLPVMKALGIASEDDLPALDAYGAVADQILVDAKPPPGGILPGGNGIVFDWRVPWMLAGGLTSANVAEAIRLTGARQVDVSSGVETAPGTKDPALIRAFVEAAR